MAFNYYHEKWRTSLHLKSRLTAEERKDALMNGKPPINAENWGKHYYNPRAVYSFCAQNGLRHNGTFYGARKAVTRYFKNKAVTA